MTDSRSSAVPSRRWRLPIGKVPETNDLIDSEDFKKHSQNNQTLSFAGENTADKLNFLWRFVQRRSNSSRVQRRPSRRMSH